MSRSQIFSVLLFLVALYSQCNGQAAAGYKSVSLSCYDTYLNATFNKTAIEDDGRVYKIYFLGNDSNLCYVDAGNISNTIDNTIHLSVQYTDCGIQSTTSASRNIRYNHTLVVSYGRILNGGLINKRRLDYYNLICDVPYNYTMDYTLNVTGLEGQVYQQSDEYDFLVTLTRVDSNDVPEPSSVVRIGDPIYFLFNLTANVRQDYNLKLHACHVTSQRNGGIKYVLFKDGCDMGLDDPDVSLTTKTAQEKILQFTAFRFNGVTSPTMYLSCEVIVCLPGNCPIGCLSKRKRRDLEADEQQQARENHKTIVTSGVIVVLDGDKVKIGTAEKQETDNLFHGAQGIIIICLLIVVTLIGLVMLTKKFMPKRANRFFFTEQAVSTAGVEKY